MLFSQPYIVNRQDIRKAHAFETTGFPGDFTNLSGVTDTGGDINPLILKEGRELVQRHIRVQPRVLEKAITFVRKYMARFKKILAVHIRRTDKISESLLNFLFKYSDIYSIIRSHMHVCGYDGFFFCTDDQKLKTYIQVAGGASCITYDSLLSTRDGVPTHFDAEIDGYQKAEDVMIEVLCMASCSGFVSTLSNVANGVLFFGNDILVKNHYYLHNLASARLSNLVHHHVHI